MPGASCRPLRVPRLPRTPVLYHIFNARRQLCFVMFVLPEHQSCAIFWMPELRQAEAEAG
eukprot:3644503-Pyramimonas_sp.AAC.1